MKRINWWIFTVAIGAIPIILRLLLYCTIKKLESEYILNEVDIVTFGLVLSIGNLKELEVQRGISKQYKTIHGGIQILLIVVMSSVLALSYLMDIDKSGMFEKNSIKMMALLLSCVCFICSIAVYYHPKFK